MATCHLKDRIGCLYCVAVERTDCAHLLHCPSILIRRIIVEKTFKKTHSDCQENMGQGVLFASAVS